MPAPSRVAITGLGVITAIGSGKDAFWEALRAGRCGIRRVDKFDPSPYPTQFAAQLNGFDFSAYIDPKWSRRMDLTSQLSVSAAKMAVMTPNPVMATRLLVGMSFFLLWVAVSPLDRAVPLLGLEPFIDIGPAEPPVLAHLGSRNPAALCQRVQGGLRDLEVAMQLLNGQNVAFQGLHWATSPTSKGYKQTSPGREPGTKNNNCYQLLLVSI